MRTNAAAANARAKTTRLGFDRQRQNGQGEARRDDQRIIIVAPTGQDASAMATLFDAQGFEAHVCGNVEECAREIRAGAGALVFTEEAFNFSCLDLLGNVL